MDARLDASWRMAEQDRSLADTFSRERSRLRSFIRGRVVDPADAEDILQEVFYELVEASRLVQPIEKVGAWLFRVARNRIVDLFRSRRTRGIEVSADGEGPVDEDTGESIEAWLPSAQAGPEAAYARRLLIDELEHALDELPDEQRRVFVAHELDGRSFGELAAESGLSVNTLLSCKRYAVLHLRRRLQAIHDDFVEPWEQ